MENDSILAKDSEYPRWYYDLLALLAQKIDIFSEKRGKGDAEQNR